MDQPLTDYNQDLIRLNDFLGEGIENSWTHELRKEILLLLHKLKNTSRKRADIEIESELISLEVTLGYGSGSNTEPDINQVEEHQLRLLELVDANNTADNDENVCSIEETKQAETEEIDAKRITDTPNEGQLNNTTNIMLILCNCPGRDAARDLASGLVSARLAACVNIIANIGSIYWWQGEIKDTAECQLQIKTSGQSVEDVIQFIKHNHPNDVPEILAVTVDKGNDDYFDWVKQETYARE